MTKMKTLTPMTTAQRNVLRQGRRVLDKVCSMFTLEDFCFYYSQFDAKWYVRIPKKRLSLSVLQQRMSKRFRVYYHQSVTYVYISNVSDPTKL